MLLFHIQFLFFHLLFLIFSSRSSGLNSIYALQQCSLPTPTPMLREIKRFETVNTLHDIDISPKLNLLAAAGDEALALYTLDAHAKLVWQAPQRAPINDITFSADGSWLASAADDGFVTIWDVKTGKRLRVLGGLPQWATSVAFSPQGDYIAAGSYRTIMVWSTASWQRVAQLSAHQGYIWELDFVCYKQEEHCLLASTSTDQTVNIWQFVSPKNEKEKPSVSLKQTLRASTYWVRSAAFAPHQQVVAAGSADGSLYVWDLQSGEQLSLLKGSSSYIWRVAFSAQGDALLSAAEDGTVILWDWRKGTQRFIVQESEAVVAATLAEKGFMVLGLRNGTVVLLK